MKLSTIAAIAAASLLISTPSARAAAPTRALEGEHTLVYADGKQQLVRAFSTRPATSLRAPLARFTRATNKTWRADFDASTGMLARIDGGFIPFAGTIANAALAERAARETLARHIDLFAPGTSPDDFELSANDLTGDLRTVAFKQRHDGMEVLEGQISFRFKNDRLFMIASQAIPNVRADRPSQMIDTKLAEQRATAWIKQLHDATAARATAVRGPLVIEVPGDEETNTKPATHAALEVTVQTEGPIGRFAVYLDARTGAPIARRQTLMFARGTLKMNTPVRYPGAMREDRVVPEASITLDGQRLTSGRDGTIAWTGDQAARVSLGPQGPRVSVLNNSGFTASVSFSLIDGADFTWNEENNELVDAQIVTFLGASRALELARELVPDNWWFENNQLQANVNINDTCNAFSDGETINFFRSSRQCENTGRIPDVVYHEFGHAFHFQVIIPGAGRFDSSLSEGAADFYAVMITGDPATARGFFYDETPLRDLDPAGSEARYPDGVSRDPHETGLIFGGAMVDLHKAMVTELGQAEADRLVRQIFVGVMQRATGITTAYNEALATIDDDGDLSNGTPHFCLVYEAFARHGIASSGLSDPILWSENVAIAQPQGISCPGAQISRAQIIWEVRGEEGSGGTIDLALTNGEWFGSLPVDRHGVTLRYRVEMELADGTQFKFPQNVADPQYELYVGAVVPLYCTDFETDVFAEGWTHQALGDMPVEGADDWEVGAPASVFGSGDPNSAHSGTNVIGNDLGAGENDGRYTGNASNALTSPQIDTMGFSTVRLQYWRWLAIEDSLNDQARILGNGMVAWTNASSGDRFAPLNHQDREWRFQDVDLSPYVVDGSMQVTFDLTANRRRRLGGWTIDDFCVVGVAICGNGVIEMGEACDDGNTAPSDGCETACSITVPVCGNGTVEPGEACDDGNVASGDGCEASCVMTPPAVCGNGVLERGEACDDGILDGRNCAAGCVMPEVLQIDDPSSCGCTTARTPAAPASTLAFAAMLIGALVLRRRRR